MSMKKFSKELQELGLFIDSLAVFRDREYQFHPPRRWKFDFAFPDKKVAVEYEGGIYRPGGGFHQSISIMEKNMSKYNQAALDGWKVLRFCAPMVRSGEAFKAIEQALQITIEER